MINSTYVRGAYGRKYKTEEAAQKDWDAGKDFQLVTTGQYCSKRDFDILDSVYITFFSDEYGSIAYNLNVKG
jgi:hypothetical protein